MCTVHHCTPAVAVQFLRTHQSKLIFCSDFKFKVGEADVCPFDVTVRQFNENELVWRHVPRRSRRKPDDVFTGPHRVLKKLGDYTYRTTSHLHCQRKRSLMVNINDINNFTIPDTSSWKSNPKYLVSAKEQLNCINENLPIFLNFQSLETFNLHSITVDKTPKLFVIPDWPCVSWYKPLHDCFIAEAVVLPKEPDLFLDANGNALGSFSWKHWLFYVKGN